LAPSQCWFPTLRRNFVFGGQEAEGSGGLFEPWQGRCVRLSGELRCLPGKAAGNPGEAHSGATFSWFPCLARKKKGTGPVTPADLPDYVNIEKSTPSVMNSRSAGALWFSHGGL
jgi:hypothetical protein